MASKKRKCYSAKPLINFISVVPKVQFSILEGGGEERFLMEKMV